MFNSISRFYFYLFIMFVISTFIYSSITFAGVTASAPCGSVLCNSDQTTCEGNSYESGGGPGTCNWCPQNEPGDQCVGMNAECDESSPPTGGGSNIK